MLTAGADATLEAPLLRRAVSERRVPPICRVGFVDASCNGLGAGAGVGGGGGGGGAGGSGAGGGATGRLFPPPPPKHICLLHVINDPLHHGPLTRAIHDRGEVV